MTKKRQLDRTLDLLSMGWGVQSWTLAAMSVLGVIPGFDYVVNADTAYESEETYTFQKVWTPWLIERGARVVKIDRTGADVWTASDLAKIPAFTISQSSSGERRGMKQRSCTRDWKILPQNQWTRAKMRELEIPLLDGAVRKSLGISTDEYTRMKHSELKYIEHVYPLIEMRMSRSDCVRWLTSRGLPVPPKSACVFCPYTNSRLLHSSVNAPGANWENKVRADNLIRDAIPGMKLYVSDRGIPLEQVAAKRTGAQNEQLDFIEMCDSGYCFV